MATLGDLTAIRLKLHAAINTAKKTNAIFFKTGAGHYAEHDRFIGVSVPQLRRIAKQYTHLNLKVIQRLLRSPINEERLLALIILVSQYQHAEKNKIDDMKNIIYEFYVNNLQYVNNWNLVDASAHYIVGAHLNNKNKSYLLQLTQSKTLWERRIAIVATWYFIRNNNLNPTFKIATKLLHDEHDLIHKAVGWMLREAGKRDQGRLVDFLSKYARVMPRTMLRYAIEKFPAPIRKGYLSHAIAHS